MKLKFDSQQSFQLEAIQSIVDLFSGQRRVAGQFGIDLGMEFTGSFLSELGFANGLTVSEGKILSNLQAVQTRNRLAISPKLDGMNFSVEMETGTGKTYVYLRTIHELHQQYGLSKFIIVVPSVAIREGVLKSLELTREHFRSLYDYVPVNAFVYDSKRLSALRGYANSNGLQIMIMNIDAFNRDSNVIRRAEDLMSGRKPLDFIQATHPVETPLKVG